MTQTATGIAALLATIRRHQQGEKLLGEVDPIRGY